MTNLDNLTAEEIEIERLIQEEEANKIDQADVEIVEEAPAPVKKVKKVRKVDVKKEAKTTLSELLAAFLTEQGYEVNENHEDYGFTGGTIVVGMEKTDIQLKLITPKAGLERYQEVVYVDEV